jgi:hypothetical protein
MLREKLKRTICLALGIMFLFGNSLSILAAPEYLEEQEIILEDITHAQIPANVIPLEFDTEEEAIEFIKQNTLAIQNTDELMYFINPLSRVTTAHVVVSTMDFGIAKLSLNASYTTSGNNKTGIITSISPYVAHSGFTLGVVWKEYNMGYTIANGGKDAYIYTNGCLEYYLLINGLIKLGAQNVGMGRTCFLAR